ncbi:hypothetical protein Tco_0919141, partial [Tanacetum coccineum]
RGMDIDSVNVPYLLARYLRLFASRRKQGVMIFKVRELPIIEMDELVRPQICKEIDDTWAWVASGRERQPDATAGAPGDAEDAPAVVEGALAVPTPVHAPQPPPPLASRTMP